MTGERKNAIRQITMCAVMAAVLCVMAPWSIPIGPVPISLGTLALYLTVGLLGWKLGAVSTLVYLALGFAGVPVFTGYTGGLAKLVGPTGGYLVGYIPLVLISGLVIEYTYRSMSGEENSRRVLPFVIRFMGMVAGTAVLYAFGTAWYCILSGNDVGHALGACVLPFIPVDLVKMVVALAIMTPVRSRLKRAGLMQERGGRARTPVDMV